MPQKASLRCSRSRVAHYSYKKTYLFITSWMKQGMQTYFNSPILAKKLNESHRRHHNVLCIKVIAGITLLGAGKYVMKYREAQEENKSLTKIMEGIANKEKEPCDFDKKFALEYKYMDYELEDFKKEFRKKMEQLNLKENELNEMRTKLEEKDSLQSHEAKKLEDNKWLMASLRSENRVKMDAFKH